MRLSGACGCQICVKRVAVRIPITPTGRYINLVQKRLISTQFLSAQVSTTKRKVYVCHTHNTAGVSGVLRTQTSKGEGLGLGLRCTRAPHSTRHIRRFTDLFLWADPHKIKGQPASRGLFDLWSPHQGSKLVYQVLGSVIMLHNRHFYNVFTSYIGPRSKGPRSLSCQP